MARPLALVAPVIVALLLMIATPVAAAEVTKVDLPNGYSWLQGFPTAIHDFHWSDANGGRWVDDRCGTSRQRFRIELYQHRDYGGNSVVLCHNVTHGNQDGTAGATFCEVPLGVMADVLDTATCNVHGALNAGTANDMISSIDIIGLGAGKCLRLFEHRDHKGRSLVIGGDIRNLHKYRVADSSMGDRISSVKKRSKAKHCTSAVGA